MTQHIHMIGIDSPAYIDRLRHNFMLTHDEIGNADIRGAIAGYFLGQLTTSDMIREYRTAQRESGAYKAWPEALTINDQFFASAPRNVTHDLINLHTQGSMIFNHHLRFNATASELIAFDWRGCNFEHSVLVSTTHSFSKFRDCYMSGDFRQSEFYDCKFTNCIFDDIKLSGVRFLEHCVFNECDFSKLGDWRNIHFDEGTHFYNCIMPREMEAEMRSRNMLDPTRPNKQPEYQPGTRITDQREKHHGTITGLPTAAKIRPDNPRMRSAIERIIREQEASGEVPNITRLR